MKKSKVQDLIGNETGIRGELEAVDFLREKGYTVIATNVKFEKVGELDIIAKDKDTLVIVEVKARNTKEFGEPLEYVTPSKIRRIVKCTEMYILESTVDFKSIRFDVISIFNDTIEHIKDAFYGHWH